ncbi:MAG: DUF1122 domain-containing protein [Chloroflexi bacterium]|nr:DUF1122 domain-containing protein [Chloroflexota bacterium]
MMAAARGGSEDGRWQPASERPDHPLAAIDGASLGGGLRLAVLLGPRSAVGSTYFRCMLDGPAGPTTAPVIFGLHNSGPFPGFNWVEVLDYSDAPPLAGGGVQPVSPEVERTLFGQLASLVPTGGHLMAEYDSRARTGTARALAAGVPPVATPLGALLFDLGCGVAFRDWYISEGGREGPRKLQGFRAAHEEHARRRGLETIAALDAFLAARRPSGELWALTEPLARRVREELSERYGG